MGRAIVIAVLMFIQAIMVVIQARFLSQAVVNLWNLKPVGTIDHVKQKLTVIL